MQYCKGINADVNVTGNKVSINVKGNNDDYLPLTDSLALYLGIAPINGVDIKITQSQIIVSDNTSDEEIDNYAALLIAAKIKEAIIAYNTLLKDVPIPDYTVYGIEFEPNGKIYWFKSDKEHKIGEVVVAYSKNGIDYGKVKETKKDNPNLYANRSICKSLS
jgi:hypothetical protein